MYYFDLYCYFYQKEKIRLEFLISISDKLRGFFWVGRGGQLPPLDPPWLRPWVRPLNLTLERRQEHSAFDWREVAFIKLLV